MLLSPESDILLFTSNDFVTFTATLTFHLFDRHCDGQNRRHSHFVHQHSVCYSHGDPVAGCGLTFMVGVGIEVVAEVGIG